MMRKMIIIIMGNKYRRGFSVSFSRMGEGKKKSVVCEEKKYALHIHMKIV
jgi:hypothetical protein